jgi:hypothetical protein
VVVVVTVDEQLNNSVVKVVGEQLNNFVVVDELVVDNSEVAVPTLSNGFCLKLVPI